MNTRLKRVFANLALVIASVLIALILSEVILRVLGHQPKQWQQRDLSEPVMNMPDPILGWRSKPGDYTIPAYQEGLPDIKTTIWENGARATAPERVPRTHPILLVGGSFTFGLAISDEETFGYKLQQHFPSVEIVNLGASAYGSYQALLILKEYLEQTRTPPVAVLYGFSHQHELRNVAHWSWQKHLASYSRRHHVYIPYCSIGSDDRLVRHDPERYPEWFLDEHLAVVAFAKENYVKSRTKQRESQRREVTLMLLELMHRICQRFGTKLIAVFLDGDNNTNGIYRAFFRRRGIDFVDASSAQINRPEMKVPGEGHPNGAMNTIWADRIAAAIEDEIRRADPNGVEAARDAYRHLQE